jgi:hypothetical protein
MPTSLVINGTTISPTPSGMRVTPARHKRHEMVDGTHTVSKRSKGAVISVEWGNQAAYTAAMANIRTALGSTAIATVAFTDPTGTSHSYTCVHEGLPAFEIRVDQLYGAFSHTFYESS